MLRSDIEVDEMAEVNAGETVSEKRRTLEKQGLEYEVEAEDQQTGRQHHREVHIS